MSSEQSVDNVAVLGLGLMGGSLAAAFSGHTIGYARRHETLDAALAHDLIDEGATTPEAAVKNADLVVLCTPILTIPGLLEQIRDHLKPGAIVTDVGSTKRVLQETGDHLLSGRDALFVGSHPMCGSDQVGIESAIPHLYDGARVVVMDVKGADVVTAFWSSLGSEVLVMTPEAHDEVVAASSHLPHMAAVALVQAVTHEKDIALTGALCGSGFRDTTRVANGSAGVWRDIVETNAQPVKESLQVLQDRLGEMVALIEREDFDGLEAMLAEVSALRSQLLEQDDG